jgi:ABC-2 type transport system permease protein
MWTRVRSLIVKELLALLRDPKARLVLIVPPIVQLLVLSYAATLEVKNVDLAVLNRDAGRYGHELLQRMDGSTTFRHLIQVDSPAALREAISMQRAIAALHIDADFSRAIAARRPAKLQLILDGRRSNAAQVVAGYVGQVVDGLAAELAGPRRMRAARPPSAR